MADTPDITIRAAVNHTDTMATAKNVATNGRWFSALIVAANCAGGDYRMAALAAVPVGLAAIGDQLPAGQLRVAYSVAIYAMAAVVALISIINLG